MNYPSKQPACCVFSNDSMESYEEGYDSDGFLPCYYLQALDKDPNDFKEAVLGSGRSLLLEIAQLIPESTSDGVRN